ncbi:hypothetical protein BV898_00372 [Hypsibius exemplaris]|uniref:BZIP domain-containing protein n=1 Tax=Hypsibius exemplaris TaxID=2072580 RepID=A0A1W0XFK2_HYPEX|nr:hypothetical protein BV898_00372 [Hypsibius exemplaris]
MNIWPENLPQNSLSTSLGISFNLESAGENSIAPFTDTSSSWDELFAEMEHNLKVVTALDENDQFSRDLTNNPQVKVEVNRSSAEPGKESGSVISEASSSVRKKGLKTQGAAHAKKTRERNDEYVAILETNLDAAESDIRKLVEALSISHQQVQYLLERLKMTWK